MLAAVQSQPPSKSSSVTNPQAITARAEFPRKLKFLFEPHTYKIVYGGRAGLKTENFSQALLILGARRPLRILCTRETQLSIADSVHATLAAWVKSLHLEDFYAIQKQTIEGKNGTLFIFAGLKDIASIKSKMGIDITWVEEAQRIRKQSWEVLIPTVIRKPGSELWVSFNPELDDDNTNVRFVINPPPNSVVVKTTYRDNPWLSEESRIEIETLRDRDYQAYLHVWEGETKSAVAGAVYGDEMRAVEDSGRVTEVAIDRLKPVDTAWDLGYFDTNAIWFFQAMESGIIRVIDYLEVRQKSLEWIAIQLQTRQYAYGIHWLPWDGIDAMLHHRMTGDRTKSPDRVLRGLGMNVRIAAKLQKSTTIQAARAVLPNCLFDRERCYEGLRALKSYQWGVEVDEQGRIVGGGLERREPLHDWASHGASAFGTLAVSVRYPEAPVVSQAQGQGLRNNRSGTGWMGL